MFSSPKACVLSCQTLKIRQDHGCRYESYRDYGDEQSQCYALQFLWKEGATKAERGIIYCRVKMKYYVLENSPKKARALIG